MSTRRDDGGVLVARSRRTPVRTELRARALIVFESVAVDPRGRIVASHLTSVTVPSEWRTAWTTARLEAIAGSVNDESLGEWADESTQHHREFWRRRRDRHQSIADARAGAPAAAFQPGLFDRRATDAHHLAAAEFSRLDTTRASLVDAAERLTPLTLHRLLPRLVLVP